jgi:hypothetical protein
MCRHFHVTDLFKEGVLVPVQTISEKPLDAVAAVTPRRERNIVDNQ